MFNKIQARLLKRNLHMTRMIFYQMVLFWIWCKKPTKRILRNFAKSLIGYYQTWIFPKLIRIFRYGWYVRSGIINSIRGHTKWAKFGYHTQGRICRFCSINISPSSTETRSWFFIIFYSGTSFQTNFQVKKKMSNVNQIMIIRNMILRRVFVFVFNWLINVTRQISLITINVVHAIVHHMERIFVLTINLLT